MFAFAYDVFLTEFSLYSLKSQMPSGEVYTSAYNFAAGSFGGEIGGEIRGNFGSLKFFSSGSMERTDDSGNTLGSFSSNFMKLSGGKRLKFGNFDGFLGLGISYVSLDPKNVGIGASLLSRLYATGRIKDLNLEGYLMLDNAGYEIKAVGSRREILPYRVSFGGRAVGDKFSAFLELGRYYMGNFFKLGGEMGINVLNLGFLYDSRLRSLNGGYGTDFLSGLSIFGELGYKRIKFGYSYTFMGLFGSRNLLQLSYELD
ncbi:hypothetical protein ThvES_00020810 [Thiovulum sp. ES]|nr:hypothetical protein ThvES_00020810 [Thiovulum sp. ES]